MRIALIIAMLASMGLLGWTYRGVWAVDPLTVPAVKGGWAFTATGQAGTKIETASFAAGCFWGSESVFRKVPGVVRTRVGYKGGTLANPDYVDVAGRRSGHVEAVDIEFDPGKVSYCGLLNIFFDSHDPTGVGESEYRSVIFYHSTEQQKMAEEYKSRLEESGVYANPITTAVVAAETFYPAEAYHQQYYESRNSNHVCGIYNGKKSNQMIH